MQANRVLLSIFGAALAVAGCSGGGEGGLCANVKCQPGLSCAANTGKCVADSVDASGGGTSDLTMSGTPDLSMNGDMSIAGDDAGPTDDAGGNLMAACMMPTKLTFANGVAKATGDTSTAQNNTSSFGCGGVSGGDIPYSFTVAQTSLVDAQVVPDQNSASFDSIVYLRTVCDDETIDGEIGCAEIGPGMAVDTSAVLKPGTYFVWVDGYNGTMGKFSLTVTLSAPPPAPTNDMCNMPATLTFDNMGHATAMGDLRNAADDAMGSCGAGKGNDAVYTFTTQVTQNMTATVTQDPNGSTWAPDIFLRKVCASNNVNDEVQCDEGFTDAPTTEQVNGLAPGTYFLWVDSDSGATGKYTLDVTMVTPPMNDTCASPTVLTLVNNTASATFDTTNAADDEQGNCDGFSGDVVYSFTLNAAQEVIAQIVPDVATPDYQPALYIRTTCADSMSELACNMAPDVAKNATVTIGNLPAGTYFLWVDGDEAGKGKVTLTTKAPPPPPSNDSCAMPKPILKGVMAADDTTFAAADLGTALSMVCDLNGTMDFPGRDMVYAYTALATAMVTITLHSDGTWDPALWISPGMCKADGSNCTVASDAIGNDMDEVIMLNATMGTTYYLVVDSYDLEAYGPFTLTVQ